MEQQFNVVEPVSKVVSVEPAKKVKISRFQNLLNRISKYKLEKKKNKLEGEKRELQDKTFITESSLRNINERLDKLNCAILNTDLGVKTKMVSRIKKSKPIRLLASGFELIGERVAAINEAVSKKMWGYVANKLEEYGYSQEFAKAVDTAVAHRKDDFSFAENADNLSKTNDKANEERNRINEADEVINKALSDLTFTGGRKKSVDDSELTLKGTGKSTNKSVSEAERLRFTGGLIENKEEKAKESKFTNRPIFETEPLKLVDNLLEKETEKVDANKKVEENQKAAEVKKATNATISSDYSNPGLEALLSEFRQLQEDTNKQRNRNGQIKEEKEKQDSVNKAAREEVDQLTKEKAERNKALLEFVRESINKQRQVYNQVKQEGDNLQQQLSSAKETGKDLTDDVFKNKAELTSINAKYDQIAKMIDESNVNGSPDLENKGGLKR